MYKLNPYTICVLEGPDNSGKSSVIEALRPLLSATFTHMPSGKAGWSKDVYGLLEGLTQADKAGMPTISRQLLHLACHHEHFANEIAPVIGTEGIVMDRCWVSAYIYGWIGDSGMQLHIDHDQYVKLIQTPLSHIHAGDYYSEDLMDPITNIVVFYLGIPYNTDPHNTSEIVEGYEEMHAWYEKLFPGQYRYLPQTNPFRVEPMQLTPYLRARLLIEKLGAMDLITYEEEKGE